MKHLNKIRVFTFVLMLMAGGLCSTAKAQAAEIVEPDTTAADLMYLVAADNSLKALPMEDGKMEKHKNKFGKLASIVSTAANAANTLAGAEGMDFTFSGSSSALKCKHEGKDVKVLINLRAEKREDGMALFKVVRFASSKKDRRLQWFQTKAALINTADSEKADKAGYLSFGYQNFGDHSSIITIPAARLTPGDYGVFYLGNMISPTLSSICYTFSVE